jgi:hypothetical protein
MMPPIRHFLAAFLLLAAPAGAQTISALSYNQSNNVVVATQRIIFPLIGISGGTAAAPTFSAAVGTNTFGLFAATVIGTGPHLGLSVDGTRRFFVGTNTIRAELPISFSDTTNAAITRTNLGLGAGIITNIAVLVPGGGTNTLQFSNGVLTNVTDP